MPKLNFGQTVPESRDIGGMSGKTLLIIANGMMLAWAILIHIRL